MTSQETKSAARALMNWFESQDIMPADAASIMTTLMATALVSHTRDITSLQQAANATRDLLVLDIAILLRNA